MISRASILCLLEGSLDRLACVTLIAGTTVRRLAIPSLLAIWLTLGLLVQFPLKATPLCSYRTREVVAVRTLPAKHRSLASGQAVSPPLQRDRIQLRARRVAQLQTWPYLSRRAARLQRWGGRTAPIRPLIECIKVEPRL